MWRRRLRVHDGVAEHVAGYTNGPIERYWAGVTLTHRGRVIGALCIGSLDRAGHLREEDRTLMAFAASHVLLAMDRHGWWLERDFSSRPIRPHAARLRRSESLHPMDVAVMKMELRQALKEGQFEAYLQPIHRLRDRAVVGFESLLRWNHPKKGLLTPCEFIDVAVDHDLMTAIDCRGVKKLTLANMFGFNRVPGFGKEMRTLVRRVSALSPPMRC